MFHVEQPRTTEAGRAGQGGTGAGRDNGGTVEGRAGRACLHNERRSPCAGGM